MTEHNEESEKVRRLLQNHELKVILDSPRSDYRFEYYTTMVKAAGTNESRRIRTYRLLDLIRGGITPEPWDSYDLDKQTTLVANLIECGGYRISKVVTGWTVKCPACGHLMQGNIWESVPTTCGGKGPPKCRHKITDENIVEEMYAN